MPDEATPHTPVSADKVVERVQADRDKVQTYIIKCRFRWPFLITACLIGTGAEVITDVISGVPPTTWYLGTLGGAGFYLFLFALIQAGLRANLRDSNQLLAGTDSTPQISTIPTPARRTRKPFPERTWRDHPLFVATVAVAGTVYLMFTAVIPTWLKEKDNQIAELKTEPIKLRSELDDAISTDRKNVPIQSHRLMR
jgi:hypothetical protein